MLKRILSAVTILIMVLSSASAKMSVEEKEFHMINTFLALQIYMSQIKGADHLMTFENLKVFQLPSYNADKIEKDFKANKITAQKKYSTPFSVDGVITSLKQTTEGYEIGLRSTKSNSTEVIGVLGKEYNGFNQPLKIDKYFSLTCREAIFDGTVYAKRCAPEVGSLIIEENQAAPITKAFLSGYAPDNSPCFSWETSEKCNFSDFLPFKGNIRETKDFQKAYEKGKNFYRLP